MDGFMSFVKNTVTAVGEEIKQQAAIMAEESLGVHYVTRRILACGFPYDDTAKAGVGNVALPVTPAQAASGVSVRHLANFLDKNHRDRYMIWNLSERSYSHEGGELLHQQVIEFKFPGYPAPPLNQVFSLCNSIHAWLQADENNVALIHCQTGRGRTVCAIAWYLAWSGQLPGVSQSLAHVIRRLGLQAETALIPTQQRYMDYLTSMLAGKRPNTTPILLERVIMNGIPRLGDRQTPSTSPHSASPTGAVDDHACRPYLQIFRDAKLVYTSTGRDSTELRWYNSSDSCILFPVNLILEGDILVRIRHMSSDNRRISMLRFGFHTGFITPGNTRFLKSQLDGAYNDPRFDKSFMLDLIFRSAPMETEQDEEEQKKQQQYWDQINSARRQTKPEKAGQDLQVPIAGKVNLTGEQRQEAANKANTTPSPTNTTTPSASASSSSSSKNTLGSLFSSASSKLSSFSLFGGPADSVEDAETRRLRELDESAMRKAKQRAATEAAVQAALAFSPRSKSKEGATSSSVKKTPVGADQDSFADLQAYVSGLGALDSGATEVDSDEEFQTHQQQQHQQQTNQKQSSHTELDDALASHFNDATQVSTSNAATANKNEDADLLHSLGLDTTTASVTSLPTTPSHPTTSLPSSDVGVIDFLSPTSAAALEAELAALQAQGIGAGIDFSNGGDDELVLDDADEAALLASLQEELAP